MIDLNINMVVDMPVNQVFDFISTPENDFQWQYGTLASSRLSEHTNIIGTFFRSVGHMMGRRTQSTFEVIEYEQNKVYGFKSLSGDLHFCTSYSFEIANGGTKVNISTQAHVGKSSQMDERILEKKMKKQLMENLKLLKSLLEEQTVSMDKSQLGS